MRRFLAVLFLSMAFVLGLSVGADAQRSNTFYVNQFDGNTVGEKITAAQNSCIAGYACFIVIDPDLAAFTEGVLPAPCALCKWEDFRSTDIFPTPDPLSLKTFATTNYAHKYAGANGGAKINACIAALPATGGVCDARGFGATTQVISAAVSVGTLDKPVRLIMDTSQTRWNITATGGIDVFQIGEGSTLEFVGNNFAYSTGAPNMPALHVASGANIQAVIAPLNREGKQNVMNVEGGTIVVDAGATVSSAVIDVQGVFINSHLRDVNVLLQAGTIGLRVRPGTGANGGLKIVSDIIADNVQVNGLGTAGARPLVIETAASAAVANITFLAGGFQHAASGGYEIEVNGSANTANGLTGVFFYGTHYETRTGSLGVRLRDARNVVIYGGTSSGGGGATAPFELTESVSSALQNIQILGVSDGGGSTPTYWVSNTANAGTNVPFGSGGTLNYAFKSNLYLDGTSAFSGGIKVGTIGTKITAAQHVRVSGCATTASVGAVCTSTVTWGTTFADANYTAVCSGDLVTSGVPQDGGLSAKVGASVTYRTVAATAAAAQFTTIDCVAFHD